MKLFYPLTIVCLAFVRLLWSELHPRPRVHGDSLADYVDAPRAASIAIETPLMCRCFPPVMTSTDVPARPLGIDIRSPRAGAVIYHRRRFLTPPLGVKPELN